MPVGLCGGGAGVDLRAPACAQVSAECPRACARPHWCGLVWEQDMGTGSDRGLKGLRRIIFSHMLDRASLQAVQHSKLSCFQSFA